MTWRCLIYSCARVFNDFFPSRKVILEQCGELLGRVLQGFATLLDQLVLNILICQGGFDRGIEFVNDGGWCASRSQNAIPRC